MLDLNDLLKPYVTKTDLDNVRIEHLRLKGIIDGYIAGVVSVDEFKRARSRLRDLSHLVDQVSIRMRRNMLRII
jgi:hypothetical protein